MGKSRTRYGVRPASPDQAWSGLLALALALALLAGAAQAASPAVEAALALPRTQPRHYVEAALALSGLGAAEQAAGVVDEMMALQLDDAQLVELVESVGTASLAQLGRELPAAAPLVDRALGAANAAATSPERLGQLVEQLSGDRPQAIEAIRALRLTGGAGVSYCLQRISDTDDATVRARLREALVALDPISRPAIFEATGSDNENVAVEAFYALGRLAELDRIRTPLAAALPAGASLKPGPVGDAARWAYVKLTGQPPTTTGVEQRLDRAIDGLLEGAILFSDGADTPENFDVQLAARLAADRAALDPSDRIAIRRALLLGLETGGADTLATTSTSDISAVLGEALDAGLHRAARVAVETLGERADPAALATFGGKASPLARALEASHPAVRFAAVEAVVSINPQSPFAGSSRLADALLHFATATGDDVAVVAYPQLAKAGQTAGWLLGAGYAATPANRGADAVRVATGSPDTRIVLIDMSVSLPGVRETVFRLRRSPSTALVPVVVLAPAGRLEEAHRIADEHGGEAAGVIALPRPHSPEATVTLAQRLTQLAPAEWPDAETRLAQAEAARQAVAKIAAEGPSFYGLADRADQVVALTGLGSDEASLATLIELGTPESQLRLLDAASFEMRPIADRSAAAEAFGESVARHGVLLTTDQIRRQYDRYNLSATAPEETQRVLGRLLDLLEGAE